MAKSKSQYNFTIAADPAAINQVIFNYLRANNFEQKLADGRYYYERNDAISGRRLFEYSINGSQVTIWAYVGSYKHPQELTGFAGAVPKQSYKESLQLLFSHLNALSNNQAPAGTEEQQQAYQSQQAYQMNQSMQAFQAENNKGLETGTVIGFIISLVGLILSFFGMTYGVLIIFLEYYLGSRGLKSGKRGLAIATIVIASISLVIVVVELILSVWMAV
ncbi:MAG: hypothetical protein NC180_05300 [Muribaculaceae bacterium]|nr:hypothetical protein [Roseburia sp.]MCM1430266.1 hypothetical protein [Muribaculaceae bacterium]MCM1492625.1 hypothetical protein [Muribaculaceae bacterium]